MTNSRPRTAITAIRIGTIGLPEFAKYFEAVTLSDGDRLRRLRIFFPALQVEWTSKASFIAAVVMNLVGKIMYRPIRTILNHPSIDPLNLSLHKLQPTLSLQRNIANRKTLR